MNWMLARWKTAFSPRFAARARLLYFHVARPPSPCGTCSACLWAHPSRLPLATIALNDWIIPSSCGTRATMADSSESSLAWSMWKKASIRPPSGCRRQAAPSHSRNEAHTTNTSRTGSSSAPNSSTRQHPVPLAPSLSAECELPVAYEDLLHRKRQTTGRLTS